MKIRVLRIGHFGKLHNTEIRLEDGLNLIYGGNESGKSTLHSFIGAMLFGLDRSRGRAGRDDPYLRYRPWDTPGAYQGSMDFEHEGHEYRITRVFYQKEKSCSLTDLGTGRKIPLADDSITSLIPQLTRTAYYNTVSMGQSELKCSDDFGAEVRNHIANLATTGGCKVNVEGALDELESRRKAISAELKGLDTASIRDRQTVLLGKEKEAAELFEKRRESLDRAKPVREEIARIKREIPDTEALRNECERANSEADRALTALTEAEERKKESGSGREPEARDTEKKKKLTGIGLGLLAVGGLLCVAGNGRSAIVIGAGVLLLMVSLVVLFAAYFAGREAPQEAPGETEGGTDESSETAPENTASETMTSAEAVYARAREDYRITTEHVSDAMRRYESAAAERERINTEILRLDGIADEYESAADRLEWELENLGDIGDALDVCRQELEEAEQKENSLKKDLEAVSMAAGAVKEISESLRDSFGASFNELLSEEICLATDGVYSAGRIDDDLNIEVMSGIDYVPATSLSAGTIRQLFAALRFATARLLLGEIKVPILLDECFAFSDEQRMRSALSALADREGQQTVLFTCRKDEKAVLDGLGAAYNYISLSD